MNDFLFRGSFEEIDPEVYQLSEIEAERQYRKLILIPSESQAPLAVREALSSAFQNVYAEGYPNEITRRLNVDQILDYPAQLAYNRRYSAPRYYQGVEYANIIEELARRRCAEAFSTDKVSPEDIFVNVQPLSGGPANNAVFHALAEPGDTIMGMDLRHGGHLSHGSSVHRTGKYYNAVHYTVDPETERISYEQIEQLARDIHPRFIIAGYSSYPWAVDWMRFREIADAAGALLFADIAHVAGLVVAGVYPSPVGIADVITFTTHKSLCGPRGASILTTDLDLARKIDRAVFPGEQGGPHVNKFAAMAIAFKLAKSDQFRDLQRQVVKNCQTLAAKLEESGFRIPYGGTDTHLFNLDCGSIKGPDGTELSGDQASRILNLAGIVVNRNTIPGDENALDPSGLRLGTPWVTQRGLVESDMEQIAEIISEILKSTVPYQIQGRKKMLRRAKVDFQTLEVSKLHVHDMAQKAGIDFEPAEYGYPHFYYIDDKFTGTLTGFDLGGDKVREFLNYTFASDIEALSPRMEQTTLLKTPFGDIKGNLHCYDPYRYHLTLPSAMSGMACTWLRDLSDGYIAFDDDMTKKIPGPIFVKPSDKFRDIDEEAEIHSDSKPYFLGMDNSDGEPLPEFHWDTKEETLRRTPLYNTHIELGAKIIPFAGWEMPVWYSSVLEEHNAVREAAGIFDVSHMGVYQAVGPDAPVFLNCVVGNDIGLLEVGESCYTHFLNPNAEVIDDLLIYRRFEEVYMIVVNASNDDKNWAWLNAVKNGEVLVSRDRPFAKVYGRNVELYNLRDPEMGEEMRVDIALQGPRSQEILLALGAEKALENRIKKLKRTQLCEGLLGENNLVVSRTGYTGEKFGYELFVHPDRAIELFQRLMELGTPMGLKPIGLGARDSLRTEAGLPLYGHEMGEGSGKKNQNNLGVAEAGFGSYIKLYKPWFIGREAYIEKEANRNAEVARFQFEEKGVRMAHQGDPVLDKRGKVIGWVTSCAVDSSGKLTGQAYLNLRSTEMGTDIYIFQSAANKAGKAPAELQLGDRSNLPTHAKLVSRFMK